MKPRIIWKMPNRGLHLTFDDGPEPRVTPQLLDLLAECKIKATFFLIGERMARHPEIVMRILEDGHTVGNHSFTHPALWFCSRAKIRQEIGQTDELFEKMLGRRPNYFRPPFGRFGPGLLQTLRWSGHSMVLWNGSSLDYKLKSSEEIASQIMHRAKPGTILLLHDGHRNSKLTLESLTLALPELFARGQKFAALPE